MVLSIFIVMLSLSYFLTILRYGSRRAVDTNIMYSIYVQL